MTAKYDYEINWENVELSFKDILEGKFTTIKTKEELKEFFKKLFCPNTSISATEPAVSNSNGS